MARQTVFKSWVPDWLIKSVLIFCMLHSMVLLGLYTSNVTYSASFLDVEPEDLQYAMCLTYGTFLATIFVESFLFSFFPTRSYFVAIYGLAALTFIASAYTHSFTLFAILRMLEGVLMALPWIPLRILLLSRFKSKAATITVFSITYGMLLMASPFIMNIAVWLLENYNWTFMAYGSAFFQLLCVGLILLTFNGHRYHRKLPLYQIDWASFVLVHTAILTGSFVLVYGEKKYWFQSQQIVLALMAFCICSGLFLVRQTMVKRPLFNVAVLRYANLRTGLLLFLLFYISRATLNLCHTTMSKIWGWEPEKVAHIQYLNVLGNAIGILLAAIMLARALASRYIFMIGFGVMAISHLWFTFLFVPDVALKNILFPYVLQGVAVGILFVPLVLFTVSSVPSSLARFSGTVGVGGRFWGNVIGFGIMQNALVFFQQQHYSKFLQTITVDNPQLQSRLQAGAQVFTNNGYSADDAGKLATRQLYNSMVKQSFLLANMEIFTWVGWGLVIIVVLLFFNRHLRQSFDIFRNKVWGT